MPIIKYINSSIRNKLIVMLILATVIPITTSILITYNLTRESVKDQSIHQNENLIYEGGLNMKFYLDVIDRGTLTVYKNNDFYKIVAQSRDDNSSEDEINKTISDIYALLKEIYQVNLYICKNKNSYLLNNYLMSKGENVSLNFSPATKPYNIYILPPHLSTAYKTKMIIFDKPKQVISLVRPIYNVPHYKALGYLSVDIKTNSLFEIFKRLYKNSGEQLNVIDLSNGKLIYSSLPKDSQKKLALDLNNKIKKLHKSSGSFELKNNKFEGINIYQKVSTPYMNWVIVKYVPYSSLYQNAINLTKINSIVVLLFLIIVVIATLFISIMFTTPIKRLTGYAKRIEAGDLNVPIIVSSSDEFGILESSIKNMMNKINTLILKEYSLEIQNKDNQLKALIAQINPHFINNALQSIGTLALLHNESKIYSLINALGKMLSYSMRTEEGIVPLSKELNHVKSYLQLQGQRFEDSLIYNLQTEEDTSNIKVPKMTIQPIVENSFKHAFGIVNQAEKKIEVYSYIENSQRLKIIINDNGPGIPENRLEEINSHIEAAYRTDSSVNNNNIGIINVATRIRLYYGEEARLTLENMETGGLKVTITIPIKKEGFNNESPNS